MWVWLCYTDGKFELAENCWFVKCFFAKKTIYDFDTVKLIERNFGQVFEDVVDILDPEMNLADDGVEDEEDYVESESDALSSQKGKHAASEGGEKE